MLPVSLNLFVFHIGQPLTVTHSNQIKNPQGVCSGMGECPISFFRGWLPAECNKGLCYAALLQICVVKARMAKSTESGQNRMSQTCLIGHTD